MSRYISERNRLIIKERALYCCEYCRIPELFSFIGDEIDHIIPLKHGGASKVDNLAFACAICNNYKGTDVGTFLLPSMELVRFYNPRIDKWEDHFDVSELLIEAKTDIGQATIKIFKLNQVRRQEEREALIKAKLFPPPDYPLLLNR